MYMRRQTTILLLHRQTLPPTLMQVADHLRRLQTCRLEQQATDRSWSCCAKTLTCRWHILVNCRLSRFCHGHAGERPEQTAPLPAVEIPSLNLRTSRLPVNDRKCVMSVPCTIGSANLTAFLPSTIGCAIIAGMPPGKARLS